nr:MAG TPA: hypothetical protein [Caudoviricetes sp.]
MNDKLPLLANKDLISLILSSLCSEVNLNLLLVPPSAGT